MSAELTESSVSTFLARLGRAALIDGDRAVATR
jgi:hypothetical protein